MFHVKHQYVALDVSRGTFLIYIFVGEYYYSDRRTQFAPTDKSKKAKYVSCETTQNGQA